ncbi:MAG: heavy metal-responsive transcriptional regulator [Deltaproteobacteria bacterium]|nr:heavy metal-responsive transcriptional regulator [Deltaproteobacteria bacterium]
MNLTIGQVAKMANVNIQTLRYYERRKILRPIARRDSGYRIYDGEAVRTVQFIKRAQQLGFSLEDIQALLSLRIEKKSKCADVRDRAEKTLREVEARISRLEAMKKALKKLIRDCDNKATNETCPILESFEPEVAPPRRNGARKEVL